MASMREPMGSGCDEGDKDSRRGFGERGEAEAGEVGESVSFPIPILILFPSFPCLESSGNDSGVFSDDSAIVPVSFPEWYWNGGAGKREG